MDFPQTIDELEKITIDVWDVKQKIRDLDEAKKELNKTLEGLERQILAYLEQYNKDSIDTSRGKLTKVNRFSFSWGKLSPEQKQEALEKFKERGPDFFSSVVSVNHQTLNSLCNSELDELRKEGRFHDKPFGIFEPSASQYLQFRQK